MCLYLLWSFIWEWGIQLQLIRGFCLCIWQQKAPKHLGCNWKMDVLIFLRERPGCIALILFRGLLLILFSTLPLAPHWRCCLARENRFLFARWQLIQWTWVLLQFVGRNILQPGQWELHPINNVFGWVRWELLCSLGKVCRIWCCRSKVSACYDWFAIFGSKPDLSMLIYLWSVIISVRWKEYYIGK